MVWCDEIIVYRSFCMRVERCWSARSARGFFKFVSSPDEDAVVASKADQYVSNFFPREPPFFFSEATGRWEMFQGDYASLEAALRARFFRLLQLDAAGRPNPKQAKSERTAVEVSIFWHSDSIRRATDVFGPVLTT